MVDPNNESFPGQILRGQNNRNKKGKNSHMMVYLSQSSNGDDFFEGAMLTSAAVAKFNNVLIPDQYFLKEDGNGNSFPFPTKPTCVRPRKHIKRNDWAPFNVVGQLNEEGLQFLIKSIGNATATFYEDNEE